MLKYQFNEHGVCINPTVPYSLQNERCRVIITLAEKEGKWYYGYDVRLHFGSNCGIGGPCSQKHTVYPTEKAALLAATDFVAGHIKSEKVHQGPQFQADFSCFREFWSYYESIRQLSIF